MRQQPKNIPGRGWGVGVLTEHTHLEKPVGKAHTQSHGSLPALRRAASAEGTGLTFASAATCLRGHVFTEKRVREVRPAPLPSAQQLRRCPLEGSRSITSPSLRTRLKSFFLQFREDTDFMPTLPPTSTLFPELPASLLAAPALPAPPGTFLGTWSAELSPAPRGPVRGALLCPHPCHACPAEVPCIL